MQLDVKALGVEIGTLVADTIAPLQRRIAELEDREPIKGEKGDPGADGRDGKDGVDGKDAVIQPEAIAEAVKAYLEANPPAAGKDGRNGIDGKDGADGLNGKDGAPGQDGRDGKDAEVTEDMLAKAVATHLAAYPIPAGRDGRDGVEGPRGPAGEPGKDGADGINGKDGKDGVNGKDGADGLSIEDFDISVSDDGRSLTVKLSNADKTVEKTIDLPFVLDRGVYDKEASYRTGDGVTRQGSFWIAQRDDPGEPGFTADCGWRLAVKKGRDGKDGGPGPRGPQGKDGKPGRDLTQIGPDGSKW